jgi:hypothetical protein
VSISPPGFHNNFNDRGGFNDRDSGRGRGGRSWRDEDNDRRSFNRGPGNFERKSSRWMDQKNDEEWEADDQQQQPPQSQNSEQSSSFTDNGDGDHQHEAPPDTDDNQERQEVNEAEPNETFDNHSQGEAEPCPSAEIEAGNTTPLCDEAESKE